jgi:hypothetical protein
VKEKEQLEGDVATLRDRMAKLQEQTTQYMRERTALNDQIAALKDEVAAKNKALEAAQNGQTAMLGKLQQDFAALSTEAAGVCVLVEQGQRVKGQAAGSASGCLYSAVHVAAFRPGPRVCTAYFVMLFGHSIVFICRCCPDLDCPV